MLRQENPQEYVKQMRLLFSTRPEFPSTSQLLYPDGSLNQAYFSLEISIKRYFRPSKGTVLETPQHKWTQLDKECLVKGLKECGVGHFT